MVQAIPRTEPAAPSLLRAQPVRGLSRPDLPLKSPLSPPGPAVLYSPIVLAIMDISVRAISLPDRPQWGHLGHQCHAPGRPILHLFSSSCRPRRVTVIGYVVASLLSRLFRQTVNRPFNCGLLSSSSLGSPRPRARLIGNRNAPHRNASLAISSHLVGVIAGVMVLSEVVNRLMMMSGSDASSYAAECGQATPSRFIEVVATTVPAGHRQLSVSSPLLDGYDEPEILRSSSP